MIEILKSLLKLLVMLLPKWFEARQKRAEEEVCNAIIKGDTVKVNTEFKDLLK